MTKIDKKITKYAVATPNNDPKPALSAEKLHEALPLLFPVATKTRPEILTGWTIKIPATKEGDRALFLTINFLSDNSPWEVFVNSKTVTHFQWIQAMTVTLSAAMQNGHAMELLAELKTIHDPATGGIWYKRKNYPSLIAIIAYEIEQLCLAKKLEGVALSGCLGEVIREPIQETSNPIRYTICPSCAAQTFRTDGGCSTCDSCGFSHCS